ncbi:ABC transporter C family member 8-like isoform X2 [Magnolia sinica]|uniref:ABC transporter C family member 8-like isoform X2 n=1 Tax=Magnolia sinica TaxID=86752 RepID=UPI00265A1694|nr:ABC transporter C family member 8-like isoform X2 [Magnolia sinica]
MFSFERLQGGFQWICEGGFDLASSCIHRNAINVLNLLFIFALFVLFLVTSIRRYNVNGNRTRDWVFWVVSACSFVTGIAYFGSGLWGLLKRNDGFIPWNSVSYLINGFVWTVLAVSLYVQRTKLERILTLVWWVVFSLLVTALNLEILLKKHSLKILDIVSWLVNLSLLFCAFRLFRVLASQNTQNHTLSQPLLIDEDKNKMGSEKMCFVTRLVFSWINPLLRLGYSKPLTFDDVPPLEWEDEARLAYQEFAREWEHQRKQSSNATNLVLRVLAKCYMREMIVVGFLALLRTLAVVAAPLLLYAFVRYSANEDGKLYEGLLLVGCLVIIKIVESFSQRHWFFAARRYGMRMRSALMVAVIQKVLKLSSLGRRTHSTGEVVNYIAVDAYRLGEFPWWFHTAWTLPLQLVLAIGVLFGTVGLGALPGLVLLICCVLINVPFAKILQDCRSRFMRAQDERLRATSEVLNNMKIIKLHFWEEKFKNKIETLRDVEFKFLAESQIKKSYGTVLYWMSPIFVSSVVFAGCAVLKSAPLNASTFFTVLATMRVMSEPGKILPEALSVMIQVKVSLDRLDAFLLDDELKEDDVKRLPLQNSNSSVRIHKGVFGWNPDAAVPTLKFVCLEISRGQKIAICGPVGSGKSSLLYALLGEIPKISGSVEVFGSIAYVSQTAWIQSGTVRDNILYGKQMDENRYKEAIRVCALDKDVDSFDHGDLTEIGQRGLNLSGGQKQRLQLARAVYNDADIYLLDDPFSAVDAQTAGILFNDCVMAALQQKTVILVTHQVEFLAEVDKILVMEAGHITQSGSYAELLKAGTAFKQLVTAHHDAMTAFDNVSKERKGKAQKTDGDQLELGGPQPWNENSQGEISVKGLSAQLTEEEEKETGNVGWKPYIDYIRVSRGSLLFASVIFSQSAFVILQAASTYWLAIASQIPHIGAAILIGVYTGISTFSGVFAYLRVWFATHLGLKASKAFFSGLMDSVFKAPMLFFDSTPVGRILTRASSDLSVVDFDIPYSIAFVATGALDVISIILIMATVTWEVLIVAIPITFIARYVQEYYLASARELIRINGMTKAPVMNYAAETSLGVVTIRAFNMTSRFFENSLRLVDSDATLFFHMNAAMEWVILRVEALQNLTIFTAALLLVLLPRGTIAPAFVGLSLSYSLTLTFSQVFLTRWHCSLANFIVSVERIKQYMHIPSEPPAIVDDMRPPHSWPFKGRIDLQDLKIRYRPNSPLVLKGITCTFQAGSRVGVVGRTGSGKTTLISALFRLVEPVSGRILIDELDICSMGLKDLRVKLSIIPQEPALFRGSVRSNLDPLGLYSDHEIWEALEKCQLATTIRSLPNHLDSSVSDEGENWSAGQRQLFCLGRVLLKRNRILVLDEVTASIDSATDAVLQRVIRREFSSCTVLTVAHRVPTVTDSDMVMVLSYGNLVEYDKPSKLMETDSSFSRLVAEYWSNCRRNSIQKPRYLQE